MKKILRLVSTTALAMGLIAPGIVMASTGSINTTGPGSHNEISTEVKNEVKVDNHNNVDADVNVDQKAGSGEAEVKNVTTAGDVTTGDATNSNDLSATVSMDNTASTAAAKACTCTSAGAAMGDATIHLTGPNSTNTIESEVSSKVTINNNNKADVAVNVDQHADSGEANVSNTTSVGNVSTGAASNTNSTSLNFSFAN